MISLQCVVTYVQAIREGKEDKKTKHQGQGYCNVLIISSDSIYNDMKTSERILNKILVLENSCSWKKKAIEMKVSCRMAAKKAWYTGYDVLY